MDRIRLSLVLVLILVATIFIACQGEAPKTEGDKEGTQAPEPTAVVDETAEGGPSATGPGDMDEPIEESGGIAEEEGLSTEVEEPKEEEPSEEDEGESEVSGGIAEEEGFSEDVGSAVEEAADEPPAGMPVYLDNCTKCHKVSGREDLGSGPLDLAGMKDKYDHDKMLEKLAAHPPGGDPYTQTLSEQEIEDLIAFVLTL